MSSTLTSYKPAPRISDTISNYNIMDANWGLGVSYEITIRNISD